jgi:hypothetical protein
MVLQPAIGKGGGGNEGAARSGLAKGWRTLQLRKMAMRVRRDEC